MIKLRYFGGKTRTCKAISDIINGYNLNNKVFVSPFVGAGWVEQYIKSDKILSDKHIYLMSMYKELQCGWIPPKKLTKEEYDYIKANPDEQPHLTGFCGFGCSFAGKWFGGYAKDKSGRNYCLNAYNSINKKIINGLIKNSEIKKCDYTELKPKNNVVYCDPPYKGTTQYDKNVVGEFNHDKFWDIMREWSNENMVFISEYSAPDDFVAIWQQETKLDIRDGNNKKQKRVEKLFIHSCNIIQYESKQ